MIMQANGQELMKYLGGILPYPPEGDGAGAFITGDDGAVKAAWLFEPSAAGALELHVGASSPLWAQRSNLRAMFHQGFVELGAKRIMTGIGETNTRSFRTARRLGFDVIGFLPDWYEPSGEGCWWLDMRRANCVWLEGDQ